MKVPRIALIPAGAVTGEVRETSRGRAYVKTAQPGSEWIVEAEAEGLALLAAAEAVRVPKVLSIARTEAGAELEIEWIETRGGGSGGSAADAASDALLGVQLATQHRVLGERFGAARDNALGRCTQWNEPLDDWVEFFRERRLRPQLELLASSATQDHDSRDISRLIERGSALLQIVDALFATYRPVPSLLHGDLWGGNRLTDRDGHPVIFDPATYFGDREADIAMTRLFGGFGPRFYAAYVGEWPLDAAAGTRRTLYNLYHVLNHANIFGGSYALQAAGMVDTLRAELGH